MDSGLTDLTRWVSLSPLPRWAQALLFAGLAASVFWGIRSVRREANLRRRWLLSALRVSIGLSAFALLLEPGTRKVQVARLPGSLAILVDDSLSMRFPDESSAGPSRAQKAAKVAESILGQVDSVRERFGVELFSFASGLTPTDVATLSKAAPSGRSTDLAGALRALQSAPGLGQRPRVGVLVVSDGADHGDWAGGFSKDAIKGLNVPVSTVVVGKPVLKDLAIDAVKVDDFAFVRSSISVEVELRAQGFDGQSVPLVLRREGQVVAQKVVTFEKGQERQTVSLTFSPDVTGRFVFTVAAPVFPDEAIGDNNEKSFVLRVIRDRLRVLLVVGRPSWDERFLRGVLKQDPNIELVSFYILRTTSDMRNAYTDERELSLIPFPMEEIFDKKLSTFDVVILQNFGYTDPALKLTRYEANLEGYVREGGALVVIGGDQSFGEVREPLGRLSSALPVEAAGPADLQSFRARLTSAGSVHPATHIDGSAAAAEAAFTELPLLSGLNPTRVREGALVLLEHPSVTVDGRAAPVLAVWDYGKGRSLAIATDSTWAWAFTAHAAGAPTRVFEKLWTQSLRWLVKDADLTAVRIRPEPEAVEPGNASAAVVSARKADFSPAAGARVEVDWLGADDASVRFHAEGIADAEGVAQVEWPTPPPGAYKVRARVHAGEALLGEAVDAVAVRATGPELLDARVDAALLKQLAETTGGEFFDRSDVALARLPVLEPPALEVGRSKDEPVWDRTVWLLAFVTLVALEWGLRRRFGYV